MSSRLAVDLPRDQVVYVTLLSLGFLIGLTG